MNTPTPSQLAEMGAFDDAPRRTRAEIEASNRLYDWHYEWTKEQVARGVDAAVPHGRPDGSDYNQHVPDIEADGAAEDEFHARARRIMHL